MRTIASTLKKQPTGCILSVILFLSYEVMPEQFTAVSWPRNVSTWEAPYDPKRRWWLLVYTVTVYWLDIAILYASVYYILMIQFICWYIYIYQQSVFLMFFKPEKQVFNGDQWSWARWNSVLLTVGAEHAFTVFRPFFWVNLLGESFGWKNALQISPVFNTLERI